MHLCQAESAQRQEAAIFSLNCFGAGYTPGSTQCGLPRHNDCTIQGILKQKSHNF